MIQFNRPQQCALGIDSGYTNTGVSVVTAMDSVLYTNVLTPPRDLDIADKILWLHDHLSALVRQYSPVTIGIEVYTAPAIKVRAMSAKAVAYHHWLIGSCLMLGRAIKPEANVQLLEAKEWMHTLTGIPMSQSIGGKEFIEATVTCRTGYVFRHNSGGHLSDAAGVALVAMDAWTMKHYISQSAQR